MMKALTVDEEDEVGVITQVRCDGLALLHVFTASEVLQLCLDTEVGSAHIRALCAAIMVCGACSLVARTLTS